MKETEEFAKALKLSMEKSIADFNNDIRRLVVDKIILGFAAKNDDYFEIADGPAIHRMHEDVFRDLCHELYPDSKKYPKLYRL